MDFLNLMDAINSVGWIGGVFLAICGAPLAWQSWKDGRVDHTVNWLFLHLWLWGEAFVLVYVLFQPTFMWPLITNYAFNIIVILIIIKYKLWPRN